MAFINLVRRSSGYLWGDFYPGRPGGTSLAMYGPNGGASGTFVNDDGSLRLQYNNLTGEYGYLSLGNLISTGEMVLEAKVTFDGTYSSSTREILRLGILTNATDDTTYTTGYLYAETSTSAGGGTQNLASYTPTSTTIASSTIARPTVGTAYDYKLRRVGTTVTATRSGVSLSGTSSAVENPPYGFQLLGGSAGTAPNVVVDLRNLAVYRGTNVTVTSLPTNYHAAVTTRGNVILAEATESSGTATLDVSGVVHGPRGIDGKLRVWTTNAKSTLAVERTGRYWGGDSWEYIVQPSWSPQTVAP